MLALILAGLSPASTMAILALWTTGLSLFLPFPIYLVALALYLLTLVACWRSGDAFWPAAGLLLVLLGVTFLGGAIPSPRAKPRRRGPGGAATYGADASETG